MVLPYGKREEDLCLSLVDRYVIRKWSDERKRDRHKKEKENENEK